jgi:MoaA/NifB/PqqE/SkfB family radical SAM enzyme
MGDRGLLFPLFGALVSRDSRGDVRVVDSLNGWQATLTGTIADDVFALAEGGEATPRLEALAKIEPAVARVMSWRQESPTPLTGPAALRLDGFGTLFVEVVGQCNERCTHCYASSSPDIDERLSEDVCLSIVDDAAALGFECIQFTGGDPLLCSFLPKLVAHARKSSIPSIEIYTNGLALSQRLLETLAPNEPSFAISLYSADPASHDAITQTPGSHARTIAAIRRVVACDLGVRVGVIAMNQNADQVDATVRLARELGVANVAVTTTFAVGRGDLYEGTYDYERSSHGGHRQQKNRVQGKLCVTYEGKVVPCVFNRSRVLGNIYERRLLDIAAAPLVRKEVRTLDDVLTACSNELQCGSCRLTACALHQIQ